MTKMRAKMQVTGIDVFSNSEGATTGERLYFRAVANCPYPADGSDENNAYAKFSPDASLSIYVANPALFGQFKTGEARYGGRFTARAPQRKARRLAGLGAAQDGG